MGRQTLNVSDTAYDLLKSIREPGESFNDVIIRLVTGPQLEDLAAHLTPDEAKRFRAALDAGRRGK